MPARPAISVLLPARDAADTIEEAVEGLLAQRGAPPFEVVCVDDGSVDGTAELLTRIARRDGRVRVLRGPGEGIVKALQRGLAECSGELIARMDADDRVHPDRLALQASFLARNPALGAAGSLTRSFPWPLSTGLFRLQEWLDSVVTAEECARERFVESPLVHPSITFRRSALDAVGGYRDAGWAEDWDLLLRLVHAGYGLAKVPQVLLWWRDSKARLTRTGFAYSRDALCALRAAHLAQGPLRDRPFDVWGAGPTGKRLARALEAHGKFPRRFIDVAERLHLARGAPVERPSALGPPGEATLVVAVGAPGVRPVLRAWLRPLGWIEGEHWYFAA